LDDIRPTHSSDADASLPMLVQEMTAWNEGASSLSITLPSVPASQHVLVLIGGAEGGVGSVTGGGVNWQTAAYSSASPSIHIWFGVTDGSSAVVTLATTNVGTDRAWLDLTEWSGLAPVNTLDAHANNGMGGGGITGTIDLQLSTSGAPELLVFAVSCYGVIGSEDASWTSFVPVGTGSVGQEAWHKIADVAGLQTAQTTYTSGWDAALAAFHTMP
jgi:hypothetical protein